MGQLQGRQGGTSVGWGTQDQALAKRRVAGVTRVLAGRQGKGRAEAAEAGQQYQ